MDWESGAIENRFLQKTQVRGRIRIRELSSCVARDLRPDLRAEVVPAEKMQDSQLVKWN